VEGACASLFQRVVEHGDEYRRLSFRAAEIYQEMERANKANQADL
jgi:hypothetical protein